VRRLRIGLVVLSTVALLASAAAVYAGNGNHEGGQHDKDHHTHYTAIAVANPNNPAQVSKKLVREKTPQAVYDQHIKALNNCDWKGLMQQYPDSYQLRLNDGKVIKGRTEAAATFAGFVKPHAQGGLCGITFTKLSQQLTDETLAVSWVANSPFLAEPYYGADAYITDDGLMVSMVSTFDGTALKFKP
jgi:hypothetical protein